MDHRWPAPISGNDKIGSVFTAPIKACFHAKGYESARERSRGWVNELKSGLKTNPYSPKNAGLVDISGITRQQFDLTKFNAGEYSCKVFGHQHTFEALLELHQEFPNVKPFGGFETKIYINLTPDMIRFLGNLQNTVDMKVKGRSHVDLMRGLRSTMEEKHGMLYRVYREALLSEFVAGGDGEEGKWKEDGLVWTLDYSGAEGFALPDVTKLPYGFYIEDEARSTEASDDLEEAGFRVLEDELTAHLDGIKNFWPVWTALDDSKRSEVKTEAFAKHHVYDPAIMNTYNTQWQTALYRQETWNLCDQIMEAWATFQLKGMKDPNAPGASGSKRGKRKSTAEGGPAKKKGKKGQSNRQVEEVDRSSMSASKGEAKLGAGILQEEALRSHNLAAMSMTFWNQLAGIHGDQEWDKVDSYLRLALEKQKTLNEVGEMVSQFKKERLVQRHLVSAAGVQDWEAFKAEFKEHWSSQAKIESLITCLPVQRGGARRGTVQIPAQILRYVINARNNLKLQNLPAATVIPGVSSVTVEVQRKLVTEARTEGPEPLLPGEAEAAAEEPKFEMVKVKPQWKVVQAGLEDLGPIPRLKYCGVILDCVYQLDKEKSPDALTKAELLAFLEAFDAKTTSEAWSICVFCGFAQQNDFLEVIDKFCSGRAERFVWHKQGVHMNPNKSVRFCDYEVGVLGYHVKDIYVPASGEGFETVDPDAGKVKPAWMHDFDLSDSDAERISRSALLRGFPVVVQHFKRNNKVVNPHQKPQALLKELINVHMKGEDPTATNDQGNPFNWILDACCGVASTSMAALRAGMNVIAFDKDPTMVSASQQRLNSFEEEPNEDQETRALKPPPVEEEPAPERTSEDEDEEEEEVGEEAGPSAA